MILLHRINKGSEEPDQYILWHLCQVADTEDTMAYVYIICTKVINNGADLGWKRLGIEKAFKGLLARYYI